LKGMFGAQAALGLKGGKRKGTRKMKGGMGMSGNISGAVGPLAGSMGASANVSLKKKDQMGGTRKLKAVGSKAEVYHGSAKHTSGGLKKKDLMKTKKGRIVSRKKHAAGKKALKRLLKAGFKAKKGTFKLFRK
jgi:hypothetical protein